MEQFFLDYKVLNIIFKYKGGPHNHSISGICTSLHEASTSSYKEYIK